jgi:membrane associated rhomboid family serine protease
MGIYDRDYYRREGPSIFASFTEHGKACKWLILLNVILFVLQLITRPSIRSDSLLPSPSAGAVTDTLELDTGKVMQGQVWRVITYAFLHDTGSFWHILFNMLFLWWFGTDVEDLYGFREFLAVYLVAATLGGIAFVVGNLVGYPGGYPEISGRCIGASGAVTAVLVLCALHFPNRIIYLFFFLPVPIWVFVIFQVASDAFTFLTGRETGTAVTVHLAGAAFAFTYYKRHWRLLDFLPSLKRSRFRRRPPLRVYREEDPEDVETVSVTSSPVMRDPVDEHLEAKLDAVLEKVARHGKESLNDGERQILMQASEIYRRKRT